MLSLSQTGNWTSYVRSKDGASELTAAGTFRDNNQYSVRDVVHYDAYGRPTSFNPADVGRSGAVIGPDGNLSNDDVILAQTTGSQQWYTDSGSTGGVGLPDGSYNSNDDVAFNAAYVDGTSDYGGGGYGVLSGSNLDNRVGYAGYRFDPALNRGGASTGKPVWHVRHRWLDSTNGKWGQMDPAGYIDGSSLYQYTQSSAVTEIDPEGLCSACPIRADFIIPPGVPGLSPSQPPPVTTPTPTITNPAMPPGLPSAICTATCTVAPFLPELGIGCAAVTCAAGLVTYSYLLCDLWQLKMAFILEQAAQRMVEAEKITVTITREMRIRIDCDNAKEDKLAFCGERVPDGDPSFFDKSRLPPLPPRRPNAPNRRRDFCEAIDDMLELARRCMAARESVINNCFGGVADAGHREAKRRLTREIEELERLREENCP